VSIPRNVRAQANQYAQEHLPGVQRNTREFNQGIVRDWIRDAFLSGWEAAQPKESKETEQSS
jgi:hypothetical protein